MLKVKNKLYIFDSVILEAFVKFMQKYTASQSDSYVLIIATDKTD